MKKSIILTLCLLLFAAFLGGCAQTTPKAENVTFTAVIDEVSDGTLLVSTSDDVGFDKARVSFAKDMPAPDFDPAVGQTVRIVILPDIAESYPVQVTAVSIELVSEAAAPADLDPTGPAFEASCYRADAMTDGGFEFLLPRMLNADTLAISAVRHIPVMRIDSAEDLASFIEEGKAYFQFDQTFGEFEAFSTVAEKYDDAFFAENALLILYTTETSGAVRHTVEKVTLSDGALTLFVSATQPEEFGTTDMADWFIVVALEKDVLSDATAFDAQYE